MKKVSLLALAFFFFASFSIAAEVPIESTGTAASEVASGAPEAASVTIKGDIIDNLCAGTQSSEKLAEFIKTHTKQCALMPNCVVSGYSIYAEGTLFKFDKESNVKIEEFLRNPESKLKVTVVAEKAGDELKLVSIENQE